MKSTGVCLAEAAHARAIIIAPAYARMGADAWAGAARACAAHKGRGAGRAFRAAVGGHAWRFRANMTDRISHEKSRRVPGQALSDWAAAGGGAGRASAAAQRAGRANCATWRFWADLTARIGQLPQGGSNPREGGRRDRRALLCKKNRVQTGD